MRAVCERRALVRGELLGVRVDGLPVLLVDLDGSVHAYVDRCAHLGVRLSEGTLSGHTLTCRAHCWQYDVRDGRGVNPESAQLTPLSLEVRDGMILLDVEAQG